MASKIKNKTATNIANGITNSTYTYAISGSNGASGSLGSVTNSVGASSWNLSSAALTSPAVVISDHGIKLPESADIKMGDFSVKDSLKRIEDRLALLVPNAKFEAEWQELKRLGDEYRALEADIIEKMKAWDILKKE